MRRFLFVMIFFALIISGCDNPLKFGQTDLNKPSQHKLFNVDLYKDTEGYQPGYTNGKIRSNQIELAWQKSTDADFLVYKLYRGTTLLKTYNKQDSISFLDEGLNPDISYQYTLFAFNKSGMAIKDTLSLKTPKFLAPDSIAYDFLSDTMVDLRWHNNAESARNFVLKQDFNGVIDSIDVINATTVSTTVADKNLMNYVSLKAVNNYEETGWSEQVRLVYVMNTPILVSPPYQDSTNSVRITWTDASTYETGYRVYRAVNTQAASAFTLISGDLPRNTQTYQDTSTLELNNIYYYYVQIFAGSGVNEEIHNSTISSFTLHLGAPTGLQYSIHGSTIDLYWIDNSNCEEGYQIFRAKDSQDEESFTKVADIGPNSTNFSDTSEKENNHIYYYYVVAYRGNDIFTSNTISINFVENPNYMFDFNINNGNFTTDTNDPDGWEWGTTTQVTSDGNLWATNLNGYYPSASSLELDSPSLQIRNNYSLTFDFYLYCESYYDRAYLEVSTDNGSNWMTMYPVSPTYNYDSYYSGYFDWQSAVFDLSTYANQTIKIRWHLTSDSYTNYDGWYIDNVSISDGPTIQKILLQPKQVVNSGRTK